MLGLRRRGSLLLRRSVTGHGLRSARRRSGLSGRRRWSGVGVLTTLLTGGGLNLGLSLWRFRGAGGGCTVVALQLEVNRSDFQRHLVAWVHGSIPLGVQHVYAIVPGVGFEPAAKRQGRNLRQVVPVELVSAVRNARHPGGAIGAEEAVAELRRIQRVQHLAAVGELFPEQARKRQLVLVHGCLKVLAGLLLRFLVVVIGVVHVDALEGSFVR